MEKKQKVWIKWNPKCSDEINKVLLDLGAKQQTSINTEASDAICFLDQDCFICKVGIQTEMAKKIMDYYQEFRLGELDKFEPFDKILFRRDYASRWNAMEYWYFVRLIESFSPGQIIPYNEETKHLLNTTDDYVSRNHINPYI